MSFVKIISMKDQKGTDFIRTLGLTKHEWEVFSTLSYRAIDKENSYKLTADLSKALKLPRMSTHITLTSLKNRGLVDYQRKGKRKFWYRITPEELVKKFAAIAHGIDQGSQITVGAKNSEFTVYHGVDGLYKVWEALLELPPETRVLGLQPTNSIKESLKKLDWSEKIQRLQESIRNKPIIIEGLLSEDYYEFFINFYKKNKPLLLKTLESFVGRSTDMTFIKKEYFNLATEMFILPDAAYITNWEEEISIKISNETMVNFLKEMFGLVRGYGKHVDQNKYIKDLIGRIQSPEGGL